MRMNDLPCPIQRSIPVTAKRSVFDHSSADSLCGFVEPDLPFLLAYIRAMIEPPSIPPTYHPFLTTTHGENGVFTAFGAFLPVDRACRPLPGG